MRSGSSLFHVRPCGEEDVEAVVALWLTSPGTVLRSGDSPEVVRRFLVQGRGTGWVAQVNDHIVGALLVGHDGRRGYFYHLAVKELWQLLGIGRSLVEAALEELESVGITRSHVMVLSDNKAGRDFWTRLGWSERKDVVVYTRADEY